MDAGDRDTNSNLRMKFEAMHEVFEWDPLFNLLHADTYICTHNIVHARMELQSEY